MTAQGQKRQSTDTGPESNGVPEKRRVVADFHDDFEQNLGLLFFKLYFFTLLIYFYFIIIYCKNR